MYYIKIIVINVEMKSLKHNGEIKDLFLILMHLQNDFHEIHQ